MMPPMLAKFSITENGVKKVNFWFPLVLIYALLLPLVLIALPFFLIAGLIAWLFGAGRTPLSWMFWIYELWCASKGIVIDVKSKKECVYIRIF